MGQLTEYLEHTGDFLSDATHSLGRRPKSSAGVVFLLLALIGFIVMWPELHRYLRIRRM